MFLAYHEIKKNKLRFILITGVLMLVAYLVFFLSGLAAGLQDMNREAVDKWKADGIVLSEEADKSLFQSMLTTENADEIKADEKAVIGQLSAIARNSDVKANVSVFGVESDGFLMPDVTEGEPFRDGENEVIANASLKEDGFAIGDEIQLSSSDEVLKITGFTNKSRFNAAPGLYTDLDVFRKLKFGDRAEESGNLISAVIVRSGDVNTIDVPEKTEMVEMETFIKNLPGYTEQNLTLTFMIYFLFIISAVIVAIFLYVLTVQKISMFGIMKASGISNGYLSRSVIAQTFLLSAAGVLIGFVLALVTGAFLPAAVPVSFNLLSLSIYGAVLIIVATAGALFSVRTIVKIDPLKAIGG